MNEQELESLQDAVCRKHGQQSTLSPSDSTLGFALRTSGKLAVKGLRAIQLPATARVAMSGAVKNHLNEQCPEARQVPGLPPDFRFLPAGAQVDVCYDATLLDVESLPALDLETTPPKQQAPAYAGACWLRLAL